MLDERLQRVADFVPPAARVADIGTDHGYLAIELKKKDNVRVVIAADLNAGPCEAARKTIRECGMEDAIEVRQGDGLAAVQPQEVDTVCIAGMGGKLISDILAAQPEVLAGLRTAVVQPQNGYDVLRAWIYSNGWHIVDEALAQVDGRIYQIIKAEPGEGVMPSALELLLGPVILKKRPEHFQAHVETAITTHKRILHGIKESQKPDMLRVKALTGIIAGMEALIR